MKMYPGYRSSVFPGTSILSVRRHCLMDSAFLHMTIMVVSVQLPVVGGAHIIYLFEMIEEI